MDKQLIEEITLLATNTALEVWNAQKIAEKREIVDRRLRNTKLLLKNYRHLTTHAKTVQLKIDELDELLILDLENTDELEVQSIKKSKRKTLLMLNFIDRMLELYREINEKRFTIVVCLYIAEEKTTVEELATFYNCTPRAIYKELNFAVREIGALLFGVESILS